MALPTTNSALVLEKTKDMMLKDWPVPEIGPDDCLVAMRRVGICGSDVHYWQHGRIGDTFVCEAPMVLGHESAGVIAAVGANVAHVAVGDPVALEPGVPCECCALCDKGKYNLCPKMNFFATPFPAGNPGHGSLARYVSHPGKWCFKLPDGVSLDEGAFCEPLSVGVYACEQKAKIAPGSSVGIFGAGPIGTLCALVANGMGAAKVVVADIDDARLRMLKDLLPNAATVNSSGLSCAEIADALCAANGGNKLDGCIDCCGVESAVAAAIEATETGGTVCLVGMGKPTMTLPLLAASCREVNLEGVFRYRNTYPKCIELLAAKKVDIGPLLTHRFAFTQESMEDAFATCLNGKSADGRPAIKCMISIDP